MDQIHRNMKQNLKLEKTIYGVKGALEKLDEEFKEFIIKQSNPKEFFELYHRFFYNLDLNTHNHFLTQSTNYAYPKGYDNPKIKDINDLQTQINQLKNDINNVENHHFFIKNGNIIMSNNFANSPTADLIAGNGKAYYIQSGHKRQINDYQTYLNLKMRVRKNSGDIEDKDFITFLDSNCLLGLPKGPDIDSMEDIFIEIKEINMYGGGNILAVTNDTRN